MADEKTKLRCVVVTPERALVDEPADFVALPLYDGEIGIMLNRAPLVGRLGFGELRIRKGDITKKFYVDGGFVQVRKNVVTVLTSKALRSEEITEAAATKAQEKIEEAKTPEDRIKAQDRARVLQRLSRTANA